MPAYHSDTYYAYDPTLKCYLGVSFDSMGMASTMQGRWSKPGSQLVFNWSGVQMGQLTAMQYIVDVGSHGISSTKAYTITGAAEPYTGFEAKYSPKK